MKKIIVIPEGAFRLKYFVPDKSKKSDWSYAEKFKTPFLPF